MVKEYVVRIDFDENKCSIENIIEEMQSIAMNHKRKLFNNPVKNISFKDRNSSSINGSCLMYDLRNKK